MEDDNLVGDQDAADDNNDALITVGLRKASWSQNQLLGRPRTVQVMLREEESFKMRWRIRFRCFMGRSLSLIPLFLK